MQNGSAAEESAQILQSRVGSAESLWASPGVAGEGWGNEVASPCSTTGTQPHPWAVTAGDKGYHGPVGGRALMDHQPGL